MYESLDMLPRPPPRPSAPPNEVASIPTVPEVSIIFGKPVAPGTHTSTGTSQANQQQTTTSSYAEWKKQNIPRVTFPPNLSNELSYAPSVSSVSPSYVTTRSSVFPMRTVTIPTSTTSAGTASSASSCTNDKEHGQMRTLATPPNSLGQFSYKSEQRRSMDSLSQRNHLSEPVLTICATTQTDTINNAYVGPSVEYLQLEFNQLMGVIQVLREEQHQMRQIMEAFITQQQQWQLQQQQQQSQEQQIQIQQQAPTAMPVFCCDKGVQCEPENESIIIVQTKSSDNIEPFQMEGGTMHRALPNVKIYSPTMKDSPCPTGPMAQSTAYRTTTPINIGQNSPLTIQSNNQYAQSIPTLPNATTERSMVMNELARKYLPSDKLTELMQDAQITSPGNSIKRPVPLRENDNFNKAPTDISNASYKYLRKYRLLPDQKINSPTHNGLQSSPYHQQKVQDSPIACVNNNSATGDESPHLDLEHIRRQPKFL